MPRRIAYVSYRQLLDDTTMLAGLIPPDISAVAGVPRSGMVPATILSQMLHVPLFSASDSGLLQVGNGSRLTSPDWSSGRMLVVDDSALRGTTLRRAINALNIPREQIVTAAVYAHARHLRRSPGLVQIYSRTISSMRFFEWNLFNHPKTHRMMSDIDGVICRDPTAPDDDGEVYRNALMQAKPFHTPRRKPIHTLITHRLERWRALTTDWLSQHHIRYRRLIMAPQASADLRRLEMAPYGTWKGKVYAESRCVVFIESSKCQAKRIAAGSGKPVICLENGAVYT